MLVALVAWPGCRPRQSLALHFLTPAGVAGTSDDPLAAIDTLEVRTEPPAPAAAASSPFHEGGHGALDVAALLGATPATLDVLGIGNGDVLSLGRTLPLAAGATTASVYVGLLDTFQPTPMPRDGALARYGCSATPFAAGDAVLLAGGASERPATTSGLPALPRADALVAALELYDAQSGSFRSVGSDLDARIYHAAVALPGAAGSILLLGGWGQSGDGTVGPLDEVVRVTRDGDGVRVEHDGTLPVTLWGHTATLLPDGSGVLIVGGYTDSAGTSLTPSAFVYTPGTGETTTVTLPSPRAFAVATDLHDAAGEILITGGVDGSGARDDALVYEPKTRSLASPAPGGAQFRATMLSRRVGHTATLLGDGHVLVVGGSDGTTTVSAPEVFDPVRLGFLSVDAQSTSAIEPRQNHQAVALDDGSLLVFAGESAGAATLALVPRVERLTPAAGAPAIGTGTMPFPLVVTAVSDALPHATAVATSATLADRSILYVAGAVPAAAPDASAALFVPCYGACQMP